MAEKELVPLEAWQELLEKGLTTIAESKGIKDEELESVYALGLDFYRTGRYKDAETLFHFLTLYSHTEKKYWLAYGAVKQVQRDYDAAIKVYAHITAFVDTLWVKPSYYAAECFLAKGDKENAQCAVNHVREFADKKTEEGRTYLAKAEELAKRI